MILVRNLHPSRPLCRPLGDGWARVLAPGVTSDDVISDARAALAIDPRSTIALNMIAYAQWHRRSQY
jgi:hypothetical protein